MTKYAKSHSEWLAGHDGEFSEADMLYHLQMIAFLQHERLAHLPVMLASIIGFLIIVVLCFFQPSPAALLGVLLLLILSGCYIQHYFFLENTVQDWYRIYSKWQTHRLS